MANESELKGLYPFLHGAHRESLGLEAALLHSVAEKARDSRETNTRFFEAQASKLVEAAKTVAKVYRHSGRLFTMGNGGSSCDASHVAVEFVHPITAGRPALAAINLVADLAMISAVGNDVDSNTSSFARSSRREGRETDLSGFPPAATRRISSPPSPRRRNWGWRPSGSRAATAAK